MIGNVSFNFYLGKKILVVDEQLASQLVGFFLGWKGGEGRGRALGSGEVKFTGQVLPTAKKITYHIHLKRVIMRKLVMGIADAKMEVDGRIIYEANDLKVGLFKSTENF